MPATHTASIRARWVEPGGSHLHIPAMEGLDPQFRILAVPQRLRPPFPFPYPAHQRGMMIEEFVAWRLASMAAPGGEPTWEPAWTYVPIYWTSYACQLSTAGRFARLSG